MPSLCISFGLQVLACKTIFHFYLYLDFFSEYTDVIDEWTSLSQKVRLTETLPSVAAFVLCTTSMGDNKIALLRNNQVFKEGKVQSIPTRADSLSVAPLQ